MNIEFYLVKTGLIFAEWPNQQAVPLNGDFVVIGGATYKVSHRVWHKDIVHVYVWIT
jgi:hypothetical protein